MIGRPAADFASMPDAVVVDHVDTAGEPIGSTNIYRFAFAFGTVALILPLAVLVGTATRLSAARREARYAAMRLVGSTPRQIGVIAAVEAFLGAALGSLLGVAGFAAARSQVAKISVTGTPFFPDTVSPTVYGYLAVLVGVPLVSVLAAVWALRRVRFDPLGVSRKTTPKPLSAWRMLPLVLGFAVFAVVMVMSRGPQQGDLSGLVAVSLILVMTGVVLAGPWLTMVGARLLTRFATGAPSLLAARRLADDPPRRLPDRRRTDHRGLRRDLRRRRAADQHQRRVQRSPGPAGERAAGPVRPGPRCRRGRAGPGPGGLGHRRPAGDPGRVGDPLLPGQA